MHSVSFFFFDRNKNTTNAFKCINYDTEFSRKVLKKMHFISNTSLSLRYPF